MNVTVVEGDLPAQLAAELRASGTVAVDTETSGLDWATDRLWICQLYAPACGTVILRNVVDQAPHFCDLIASEEVLKVFHFAPFDLRFLEAQWHTSPRRIACTKAASKLLWPESPHSDHSLATLVHKFFDVTLDKGAVRTSDWGAEVLTEDQLNYAASDVVYLLPLLERLEEDLGKMSLTDVFSQVCDYMLLDSHFAVSGIPDPLKY